MTSLRTCPGVELACNKPRIQLEPVENQSKLYTVKWPRAEHHNTRSVSGVLVESNVQRQVALHFFNETREVDDVVEYGEDGKRASPTREITYIREITNTMLISESSARQLKDVLNALYPTPMPEEIN